MGASMPGPDDGYVVERVEGDRVLLSYDVDGLTKVAVIAADGIKDWNDDDGWGVESWGQCDPAELPAAVTDELGHHRVAGRRRPPGADRQAELGGRARALRLAGHRLPAPGRRHLPA